MIALPTPREDEPGATIIDAGVGNLGNLARAFERLGARPRVTADPSAVAAASCLVLPGVGAFRPPRETLRGPLEEALHKALENGAHLLGICVGFQLLFEEGEEFGTTDGLCLLPGRIEALPSTVPLPHIGWNRLETQQRHLGHPLVQGLDGAYVYFVHSYAPAGEPEEVAVARAVHGRPFAAVAGKGRVMGTQFHPEKSGAAGLRLLANYLEICHGPAAGR